MKEIALLPDSLSRTPSVGMVSSWYARSFEEVLRYEQMEPTSTNMERYMHFNTKPNEMIYQKQTNKQKKLCVD